ncbi:uncharacterized protein Z519_00898 [Cladophialophora bantiana CBS 173.52]|uniref:Uncharacterized protein n=1 Tax=Cladophialophora bantiana (strain ATCC 10958 / CBS 173.52 / CDC B-1940 / NIH 8579) TaxID=1442370 RepID=A0A0D2I7K6_CLAB1|nr:uncharacterized protein Z519_00898 [Cladophialophora bantiana CBS 173.52]KIW99235.1 hypothetical protein Z519_00898 [Cladophialophora bantiana CBS 173.52]
MLDPKSTFLNDMPISYLPGRSEIESPTNTFGGTVHYLLAVYNAELEWKRNGSAWSTNATGRQAETTFPDTAKLDCDYDPFTEGSYEPSRWGALGPYPVTSPRFCENTLWSMFDYNNNFTAV